MQPLNPLDYEMAAADLMAGASFEYYAGGSADNLTLAEKLGCRRRRGLQSRRSTIGHRVFVGIDALLAVAGEQGAADVLNLLRSEIENALALCGAPSATDLPPPWWFDPGSGVRIESPGAGFSDRTDNLATCPICGCSTRVLCS